MLFSLRQVDCTTCVRMGRIAEHLERVINLRMVTAGTDLYDIMDLCLRIARDDDPDDSLRPRQRPHIYYDLSFLLYLFMYLNFSICFCIC